MAAAEQRIFTHEDSLRLLNEKAKESDEFVLKLQRRVHLGSTPTIIATFEGARVQHFTSPELWVPQLAGGGKFFLQGYHVSDTNKAVGSFISFSVDSEEARDVDMGAPKKPGWRGPAEMVFPKEADRRAAPEMPLYDIRTPPAPGSGDSATRTHAWPRPAGGGVHRESYDDAFGQRAGALEAERRRLEVDKLEAERDKHKAELIARDAAHKAEMAMLETKLLSEIRSSKPTGPDPMMLEIMKQQAEDRRAAQALAEANRQAEAVRQDRIDARAAEERKADRERQDKIDQRLADDRRADAMRFEKLFEKLTERKERDPLEIIEKVSSLVAKKDGNPDAIMKSVHNMVEMQSAMMGSAMDFVQHASNLQMGGGEQEPSWVKGIDRLMKGIGKMAMARAAPPPLPPAQQVVNGQPQQPQQPAQQKPAELPIIDQIIHAIRIYHPPDQVAKALIHYYKDASIQQALAEAGGDPEQAFKNRLGNWVDENHNKNSPYMKQLVAELEKQLQAAGFYADDSEPAAKESESDDGEEEAQVEEGDEAED